MKSKQEIKQWMLDNCVNNQGEIDLKGLDFSDFEGDVVISNMKVKHNLFQGIHEVGGDLFQSYHEVGGDLSQSSHRVKGDLSQCSHGVDGDLYQHNHEVKGDLYQYNHEIKGDIIQTSIKFGGALYFDIPDGYGIVEMENGELKVTNKTKQMTMKELEALVGCKFEIVEE